MLVSVIIPTYNRSTVLLRAVDSVLSQTYKNLELIVVDDGSSDNTEDLFNSYKDPRIKYYKTENLGVSAARNYGIRQACGNLIAFLDSDDEWLKRKLEIQVAEYLNTPYALCHTDEIWIRNSKRVNPKLKHTKGGGDQFYRSLELCCISPSASVIDKGVFDRVGYFNEEFLACEDYDLWLRITSEYKVRYIDKALIVKYGGHNDQLSKQVSLDLYRIKSMLNLLKQQTLNNKQKVALIKVLKEKTKIYRNGLIKRNKEKALDYLDYLLESHITTLL